MGILTESLIQGLDATNNGRVILVDASGRPLVTVDTPLPAGNNNIGDVDVATVPAPLSTSGGGAEATALRVTLASDSTGLVSVDDNAGSLTVDTPQLPAALVSGRLDQNVGAWLGSTAPTAGQKTMTNSVPVVLAADQTSIPVAITSSEKASFSVFVQNVTIAANKSMLSLLNASGSTVVIRISEIWLINTQNTAVTGVVANFFLRRFTDHTGGTLLTPQTFDSLDLLNASVTARSNATITGESASPLWHRVWSSDEWGPGTLDQEGLDHAIQSLTPFWRLAPGAKTFTLRAGEGMHIKQETASTAGRFDLYMVFTQE